jgi:protein AATF/BFR2
VSNQTLYDAAVNLRLRLEPSINTARRMAPPDEGSMYDLSEEITTTSALLEAIASTLDNVSLSFVSKHSLSELQLKSEADAESEQSLEAEDPKSSTLQFDEWRDGVLDFWAARADSMSLSRVAMGKPGRPAAPGIVAFKAIDTRPSSQIRSILRSGKHLERSRKIKNMIAATGAERDAFGAIHVRNYDDGELYRSLLREVIDSGDARGGGLQYAQLARSGRVRKKVDRRASKGRKLSYAVHDKLVGFLAPVPLRHPGPVDEIIAGLFGGLDR